MEKENLSKRDIKHYLDGLYTQDEAGRIFDNLHSQTDYGTLLSDSMDETWKDAKEYEPLSSSQEKEYQAEASVLLQSIRPKSPVRRYVRQAMAAAASIALLFLIGTSLYKYENRKKTIIYTDISTSSGETKTLQLSDGSMVTINACSKLSFPETFKGDDRHVKLTGEAYFQVAKDEKHPFVITTGNFDVKVLGTEFNVKAYGSDEIHTVNVKNGKVQVEMSEATIRLVADERFEINSLSGEYGKSKAKRQSDIWQERYLSFDKTPIRDVANELERLYNCRIIFKEGQSFDNLISGEHYNRDLESVLKSIRYASEIKYKYDKENNEIIFYK
ncbi:iron dicitrate transporter FecR [Bacteroidia bacterium]|nr:iron dicitrate transporter FecR [Bacteroidia bacterium]